MESVIVNTCKLEKPPRIQTAIQFPAVLFDLKASDPEVVAVRLRLVCCTNLMLAGAPARLVREKFAEVAPVALATTLYGPPAVAFAVNVADVAIPLAFVVAVFTPPANVPLAPLPGAVKVTATPLTGLFPASVTVATKGAPKAVLIAALCPEPLVTTTLAGAAARFVNEKFAEVAPVALATTLYGPPTGAFAVNVAEVATPLAFVVAVFT